MRKEQFKHLVKTHLSASAFILAGLAGSVNANEYIGIGIGESSLEPSVGSSGHVITDDGDSAKAVFLGKDFNDRWGGEIYYHELGEATLSGGVIDYSSLGASAILYFPTNVETLSFYARAGINKLKHDGLAGTLAPSTTVLPGFGPSASTTANPNINSDSSLELGYGAGIRWNINEDFMSRAEYRAYDSDTSAVFLTLALQMGEGSGKSSKKKAPAKSSAAAASGSKPGRPIDVDRDGVPDDQDSCPDSKRRAKVDSTGCEIISEAEAEKVLAKIDLKGVNFKSASDQLTSDSLAVLDEAAQALLENGAVKLEIQAHSDSGGAEDFNLRLSERRAKSVKDYLVGKGIDSARLESKGYGESQPIADNATAEGRAKNRRVEFKTLN